MARDVSPIGLAIVFCFVVAAVVGTSVLVAGVFAPNAPDDAPIETDAFDESIRSVPLAASGEIAPDPDPTVGNSSGTVVVDRAHTNDFQREDVAPFLEALESQGYTVRYHSGGELFSSLESADAYIVIAPKQGHSAEDVATVEAFADSGGRVLLFGEPDRFLLSADVFGISSIRERTVLSGLGGAFGMTFDPNYVYDMTHNDGGYKHVVATPTEDAGVSGTDGVVLSVPTEVRSTNGTVLLESSPNAKRARTTESRTHSLAVRDGNVLAVGDSGFLGTTRYNIGDTNEFVATLVEFALEADRTPMERPEPQEPGDADPGAETGSDDGADSDEPIPPEEPDDPEDPDNP
ncbi:MAG: DUF4350 domain-containing protein, partial [Halobacteriota archaeon]